MQFPKDHTDWKQLAENAREIEGLSLLDRERAARAFLYFEEVLGTDFLRRIESKPHPLNWLIINFTAWTRLRLARFAESLHALSSAPNFDLLLKSLTDEDKFSHNQLLIEAAARLAREGLQPSFEPTMPVKDNQKQPDLKLLEPNTRETVYMEISIQNSSRDAVEAYDVLNAITSRFMRAGIDLMWAGRMFKAPAGPHLEDIVRGLDKTIETAQQQDRFVDFIDDGTCEMAFSPKRLSHLLEHWCLERNLGPGQFQGPPYNDNSVGRFKQKLEKEQRQLPRALPNAILIADAHVFQFVTDIRRLISHLEEEVFKYPHVPIVVIMGGSLGGSAPEVVQKGEHRYTKKIVDQMCEEECLVLLNRYSHMQVSTALISKFLRAF